MAQLIATNQLTLTNLSFRAVLFRMVPKLIQMSLNDFRGFRAVLFRMVPKLSYWMESTVLCFRAVLFRMVPKR